MDVKVEGENVVRNARYDDAQPRVARGQTPRRWCIRRDLHFVSRGMPGQRSTNATPPAPSPAGCPPLAAAPTVTSSRVSDDCRNAQKCLLVPKEHDSAFCCPEKIAPGVKLRSNDTLRTGHHLIEDQFVKQNPNFPWYSTTRDPLPPGTSPPAATPGRDSSTDPSPAGVDDAPCVCTNSFPDPGTPHQGLHHVQGVYVEKFQDRWRARVLGSEQWLYLRSREGGRIACTWDRVSRCQVRPYVPGSAA